MRSQTGKRLHHFLQGSATPEQLVSSLRALYSPPQNEQKTRKVKAVETRTQEFRKVIPDLGILPEISCSKKECKKVHVDHIPAFLNNSHMVQKYVEL